MKLAVVGHVEWVDFVLVDRLPAMGEIVAAREAWEAPAGGGAMAASALHSLTGAATFFCAVGRDGRGFATLEDLRGAGLEVSAAMRGDRDQRRTLTYLTADGERTITVLAAPLVPHGDDGLPWTELEDYDGVLFFAGDAAAARACRAAKVMVSTGRARAALLEAGVQVDALVGSADDVDEAVDDELLMASRPRWVVQTEGERGGAWWAPGAEDAGGRWSAVPLPGEPVDTFGCGGAFAAALMAGLAAGRPIADACALGARVGAALLCERAPAVGDLAYVW
ncbi:PfkB family carbohydrate kinase [Baekduia sp.]|uniref:PfkB family carbohydrate kinase n=1 Tax=Baekduia sp. TaxID=2600305 RepID=UPI002DFC21F0|nr:PfkB family carbohydrate kinase [Baekduia sp.]